ncbi:retrovirus-related pol polyprotein from transposon TNT 1-94 [Tanacetum coccineum]|uniref:Retrovirus-related pol polyprotein from transposon TNT 1-94 n=1 Tax=Tanacetum coccineum TaxID=301880 RepID=A0ABQ5D025_9ASTR
MTSNRKLFSSYKAYNKGNVIFSRNLRGNIIGKGTISNDSLKIDKVEHVDNLRFNLLSIGQICDNKCRVTFSEHGKVIGRGIRKKGLYVMKLGNKPKDQICLATIDENSTLWHRRLGHANMHLIQSLASKELVRNLPKLKFDQHFCDACKIGKQAHARHKAKNIVSTTRCLELLHMDLFDPSAVRSYGGNRYTLVIVDDYSRKVKESLNVTFDETPPPSKTSPLVDDDLDEEEVIKVIKKKNLENDIEDETLEIDKIVNIKESRNHPLENVIGNLNQRTLRSQAQNQSNFFCFISTIEPKNVNEALTDDSWIVAMQEELNQFIANDVWELVPQPRNMTIIGTKWVFRNKLDENVARLKSIRILLAYACALDFKLFQMDVKSAFLNGFINEEVYVAQPPGFIDFEKLDHVYKLKKALYGLKQAPEANVVNRSLCKPDLLVLEHDSSTPVLFKEFEEDLLTYCVENGIFQDSQDTFESSDDNTNVINVLQEPIVVNQDPGVKSSQGPPLINQNCCYECGDSLDGIFCQQCICKFCGKGAHYGYNCPPKVSIISNPEQCNQTINELPQILPSVHPTCNYEDENSFIYDSKPHSFNVSPSVLTYPPQLQFETYLCELCGNNAHYGYDCSP